MNMTEILILILLNIYVKILLFLIVKILIHFYKN